MADHHCSYKVSSKHGEFPGILSFLLMANSETKTGDNGDVSASVVHLLPVLHPKLCAFNHKIPPLLI
jgi:hypothetical protein